MTINNLPFILELWDNGFNIIPIKSDPRTPTPNNPVKLPIKKPKVSIKDKNLPSFKNFLKRFGYL